MPPAVDGGATRTGSFPAVMTERPSPPPPPLPNTPEWFAWATKRIDGLTRDVAGLTEAWAHLDGQIGSPPVPATKDPGKGMWLALAAVQSDCAAILAKLDAADAATATWTGRAARVGWRLVETLIPLAVGAFLLWASGHWR